MPPESESAERSDRYRNRGREQPCQERTPADPPVQDERKQGWPKQVELLFEREAPEVLKPERQGVEPCVRRVREVRPGDEHPDRFARQGQTRQPQGSQHEPRSKQRGQRRVEASHAADVEAHESDPSLRLPLLEQQSRDQKATEDEEDFDPEKAAGHRERVAGNDQQDGDSTHAVQSGDVAKASSRLHG